MPSVAEVTSLSMFGLGIFELMLLFALVAGAVYWSTRRRDVVETRVDSLVGPADDQDSSNPYAPSNVSTQVIRSRAGGRPGTAVILFFIVVAFGLTLFVIGMSSTVVVPAPVTIPAPPQPPAPNP